MRTAVDSPQSLALRRSHTSRAEPVAALQATYHRLAILVVLLSALVSAVWAFELPIFQGEDEPAHMDYVFSLYTAGHVIRARDGVAAFIVNPYTRYLMRVSDFERIQGQTSMRVPSGYGSLRYYAAMDAGAGSIVVQRSPREVNWLVRAYPVGFYAVEALWLRFLSLFTHSITALFFAARLLCVAFMGIGLYFAYRTAVNVGIPQNISVALTAITGLFPLTSFVSSYVQPDNLAFMLVSLCLFLATLLRARGTHTRRTCVLLGLTLGALCITKLQFFVAAAIPVGALVAIRLWQARRPITYVTSSAAAFVCPSVALWSLQRWISTGPPSLLPETVHVGLGSSPLKTAMSMGVGNALQYVWNSVPAAFHEYFVASPFVASYWEMFGWRDTSLVIVNTSVQSYLRLLIMFATLAVFAVLAARVGSTVIRFAKLLPTRHRSTAMYLAVADPLFSSYVAFVILMFALFIFSGNIFEATGRQWFPYIFAGFACGVWYAPTTSKRWGKKISSIMALVLLAYVAVASPSAILDVHNRFYGRSIARYTTIVPRTSNIVTSRTGILYPAYAAEYAVRDEFFQFTFIRGSRLRITGAAFDAQARRPARVAVVLDGRHAVPTLSGNLYAGSAAYDPLYANAGFSAFFDTRSVAEGPHVLSAYSVSKDESHTEKIGPDRLFFVVNGAHVFSPRFLSRLAASKYARGELQLVAACEGTGSHIIFAGSAGDRLTDRPVAAVWGLVDGSTPYPGRVIAAAKHSALFETVLDVRPLNAGRHTIVLYAIAPDFARILKVGGPQYFNIFAGKVTNTLHVVKPPFTCSDPVYQFYRARV